MKVSEEIDKIAMRMTESFMEVDDSICWLGVDRYRELQQIFMGNTRYTVGSSEVRVPNDLNISRYHTCAGTVTIKVNPKLDANHVSIGRITLMDFFIEDILLGNGENILGDDDNLGKSIFGFYSGTDHSNEKPSKKSKHMR